MAQPQILHRDKPKLPILAEEHPWPTMAIRRIS